MEVLNTHCELLHLVGKGMGNQFAHTRRSFVYDFLLFSKKGDSVGLGVRKFVESVQVWSIKKGGLVSQHNMYITGDEQSQGCDASYLAFHVEKHDAIISINGNGIISVNQFLQATTAISQLDQVFWMRLQRIIRK